MTWVQAALRFISVYLALVLLNCNLYYTSHAEILKAMDGKHIRAKHVLKTMWKFDTQLWAGERFHTSTWKPLQNCPQGWEHHLQQRNDVCMADWHLIERLL